MGENAVDEVAGHLGCVLGMIVESGDRRKDRCACIGGELHVAQMNPVEGSLTHAEDERSALLEADIGGAVDEIGCQTVRDRGEGSHGAGKNDHGMGRVASAGDAGSDVRVDVLVKLGAWRAEKFFGEIIAAREGELFGEDAQGAFRCDEVDTRDAVVGGEGAQHFRGIDAAACSGHGKCDVAGWAHTGDYRLPALEA